MWLDFGISLVHRWEVDSPLSSTCVVCSVWPDFIGHWSLVLGWLGSSCDSKNNRLVVANIHVLFNPKRGDVKLGQVVTMLETLVAYILMRSC
jgi:hypothetical protein